MNSKGKPKLICGLDIGTTKVIAVCAELLENNEIKILGYGKAPCRGLKRGVVVDIELTKSAIKEAVVAAELNAGVQCKDVFVGIAGSHIKSLNSYGIVGVRHHEVTQADVERVIDAARAVALPDSERVLHVLPQEFFIDNQEGIRDPIGMSGVRLEAKVHIVTGAGSAVQNIVKCVRKCDLNVQDVVLEQLASSYAVLSKDEKELGVCLIDIGGGTTDIAVFVDGSIRYSSAIPIAGDQVTNDIAIALRTQTQFAEKVKLDFATVCRDDINPEATIEVPNVSEQSTSRTIPLQLVSDVVHARYEELFVLVLAELRKSGFHDRVASGIVLTGGGSNVNGGVALAEKTFGMPVRRAVPSECSLLTDGMAKPEFSTSVGLLSYGLQAFFADEAEVQSRVGFAGHAGILSKLKGWWVETF